MSPIFKIVIIMVFVLILIGCNQVRLEHPFDKCMNDIEITKCKVSVEIER